MKFKKFGFGNNVSFISSLKFKTSGGQYHRNGGSISPKYPKGLARHKLRGNDYGILKAQKARENAKRNEMALRIKMLKKQKREYLIPQIAERFGDNHSDGNNLSIPYKQQLDIKKIKSYYSLIKFKLSLHLPFILCTVLPMLLYLIGYLMDESNSGQIIKNYSGGFLTLLYGILTANYFLKKKVFNLTFISIIGLIAAVIIFIYPPFTVLIEFSSGVLTAQISFCGLLAQVNISGK